MYVEFKLPREHYYAGPYLLKIRHAIVEWAERYQIPYTEKTVKYTHRLCFEHDKHYDFFALTFPQTHEALHYRIISDLNNKI